MNVGCVWKPIKGYEGLYEISNQGDVKSLVGWNGHEYVKREKLLKKSKTTAGYSKVELFKNKKRKSVKVHRLVAMAFVPNCDKKPYINHKDGNPLNNNANNLEWCTQQENVQHALETGLKKICDINDEALREDYILKKMSIEEMAKKYNVCKITIVKILKKHNIKKEGAKYNINIDDLKEMFSKGMSNKEISLIYDCPSNLIAVRRYQVKKGEL